MQATVHGVAKSRARMSNFTSVHYDRKISCQLRSQRKYSCSFMHIFIEHLLCIWEAAVAQRVKCLPAMQETWVLSLGQEDPLEKEMATYSSTLAWKISRTKKPGRLQSELDTTERLHFSLSLYIWYFTKVISKNIRMLVFEELMFI